jgi:cation diffusion facilitator CzcD-associated flavoprotein CzcO
VFEAAVTHVARDPAGTGWRVEYARHGQALSEGFDFVVVCTGLYSNRPHLPRFPGQEGFAGEIMHVSALADRSRLAGRKVAVLGFGKSATDAALESSAVAAETSIIFRQPHWPVPPRLLNILPFKWAMLNRLTSTLIPLHYRPSTLERCVHTLGKLTLPRFHVHQNVVSFLMNGGIHEQEDAGPEPAIHKGVQGRGGATGRIGRWQ